MPVWNVSTVCMVCLCNFEVEAIHKNIFNSIFLKYYLALDTDVIIDAAPINKVYLSTFCFFVRMLCYFFIKGFSLVV